MGRFSRNLEHLSHDRLAARVPPPHEEQVRAAYKQWYGDGSPPPVESILTRDELIVIEAKRYWRAYPNTMRHPGIR